MVYEFRHYPEGVTCRVFPNDDAAIAHGPRAAQGGAIEIWRGKKLVATVDERPSLEQELAA